LSKKKCGTYLAFPFKNIVYMFFRFLCVGGIGFIIDIAITYLLITLKADPWVARIPAIFLQCFLLGWLTAFSLMNLKTTAPLVKP